MSLKICVFCILFLLIRFMLFSYYACVVATRLRPHMVVSFSCQFLQHYLLASFPAPPTGRPLFLSPSECSLAPNSHSRSILNPHKCALHNVNLKSGRAASQINHRSAFRPRGYDGTNCRRICRK